jgi:hypothetical protein
MNSTSLSETIALRETGCLLLYSHNNKKKLWGQLPPIMYYMRRLIYRQSMDNSIECVGTPVKPALSASYPADPEKNPMQEVTSARVLSASSRVACRVGSLVQVNSVDL